jgi:uncharacterized membrane protein YebE (DUF533 family)
MSEGKVAALRTVLALAYADGTLSAAEQRLVDFLIESQRLTPDEQEAVRAQADSQVDLERLGELIPDAAERVQTYEAAALVSLMDGARESAEAAMLSKLRPALGIDEAAAQDIEAKARTIYDRFMQRQSGDDAE